MADLTPSDLDAGTIRGTVERILAGPAYESTRPLALERAFDAVVDALSRALDTLTSPAGYGVGTGLLLGVVVVVGVIAWRLARRVRTDRARRATPGTLGGRTARDWEDEADRHAAEGAWGGALRCHYRALLADLVAAGLVDEVAGRTARGYLRDVAAAAPDAADAMSEITRAFEAAWYGRRQVTAADVTELRAAAATVRRRALVAA